MASSTESQQNVVYYYQDLLLPGEFKYLRRIIELEGTSMSDNCMLPKMFKRSNVVLGKHQPPGRSHSTGSASSSSSSSASSLSQPDAIPPTMILKKHHFMNLQLDTSMTEVTLDETEVTDFSASLNDQHCFWNSYSSNTAISPATKSFRGVASDTSSRLLPSSAWQLPVEIEEDQEAEAEETERCTDEEGLLREQQQQQQQHYIQKLQQLDHVEPKTNKQESIKNHKRDSMHFMSAHERPSQLRDEDDPLNQQETKRDAMHYMTAHQSLPDDEAEVYHWTRILTTSFLAKDKEQQQQKRQQLLTSTDGGQEPCEEISWSRNFVLENHLQRKLSQLKKVNMFWIRDLIETSLKDRLSKPQDTSKQEVGKKHAGEDRIEAPTESKSKPGVARNDYAFANDDSDDDSDLDSDDEDEEEIDPQELARKLELSRSNLGRPTPKVQPGYPTHPPAAFLDDTELSLEEDDVDLEDLEDNYMCAPVLRTRSKVVPASYHESQCFAFHDDSQVHDLDETETSVDDSEPHELLQDLQKHCLLGEGIFGQVWLVTFKHEVPEKKAYALKVQSKLELAEEQKIDLVIREKSIMLKLSMEPHPFVNNMIRSFQCRNFVYMLINYLPGGELFSVMRRNSSDAQTVGLPEDQVRFYAYCLSDAIRYLHSQHVIYRDLKGENVMMAADGYPVLIDFGCAKILDDGERTFTMCGTPSYLPPEVVNTAGHTFSADYWSLGVLIYEMMTGGQNPFNYDGMTQMELFTSILEDDIKPVTEMSADAQDVVRELLHKDPTQRLGSIERDDDLAPKAQAEVPSVGWGDALIAHAWFKTMDRDAILSRAVPAPWKPTLKNDLDTSCFDDWSNLTDKMAQKCGTLEPRDAALFMQF